MAWQLKILLIVLVGVPFALALVGLLGWTIAWIYIFIEETMDKKRKKKDG